MAPKISRARNPSSDPHGMFSGIVAFFIVDGVQSRRLQIWKQKLQQLGAAIEDRPSKRVTHIFAVTSNVLHKQLADERVSRFKGKVLSYQWIEDSLRLGKKVSEDMHDLKLDLGEKIRETGSKLADANSCSSNDSSQCKRMKPSPENITILKGEDMGKKEVLSLAPAISGESNVSSDSMGNENSSLFKPAAPNSVGDKPQSSLPYNPPDLNRNITQIFGKLIDIYRALGDDRRSFSYYKAIAVIEKVPFQIESAEQVKDLPSIGKSMKDHIQEIVSTGKLSKLEHFEEDEKVKTISLFGEVWGIGPATALKLYEKGHRTLDDLKNEDSLTNAQKLGLKYFHDIKTRIPRHEVQEMEGILQRAGEDVLPGVLVLCGGSFRRGKASCGDLDVVVTHPDGTSHKGFLQKYVKHLKDMKFLREDLVFSVHSEQGTDSGVDTYFGFCTYPGRELRHRIDFKVYPRVIYAFGLIAWTGNDVLNRRLRILAESKGYLLDDTGLFLATQGSGGKRGAKASKSLILRTEREVFDFLEFPWLEPHERNL